MDQHPKMPEVNLSPENLPAHITTDDLHMAGLPQGIKMNSGLALLFNNPLYERCKNVAAAMARAKGFTPDHLLGNEAACFAVISLSIGWNLNPYMVARSTYQTPGGNLGFEGKLIQAILENSGAIEGRVEFEHFGDWDRILGKFTLQTSQKTNKKYPVPAWKEEDEEGLGVIVRAQVRGEAKPREEKFYLKEFWPRNSTLWPLRPKQQICYASVRAFSNIATPGLLMGIPFDVDPTDFYSGEPMQELNPRPARPERNEFVRKVEDIKDSSLTSGEKEPEKEEPQDVTTQEDSVEAEDESQDGHTAESQEETALDRGKRILASLTKVTDIASLRETIREELEDDADLVEWTKVCNARSDALMSKAPGAKNKKK
jgi:hypothetical protein